MRVVAERSEATQAEEEWRKIADLQLKDTTIAGLSVEQGYRQVTDAYGVMWRQRINDGIRQLIVPASMREDLVHYVHASPWSMAHGSAGRTLKMLKEHYWWHGIERDATTWVKQCRICLQQKGRTGKRKRCIEEMPISSEPFEMVVMDLVGPWRKTKRGNKYVLTMIDTLTRWVEAAPIPDAESETVAKAIADNLVSRHGVPYTVLSDRGGQFISKVMGDVRERLGIQGVTSSAYHPQTQGLVERFHRTLKGMLKPYVDEHSTNWDEYLPAVMFAYRASHHRGLRASPFEALYGRTPRLPAERLIKPLRDICGEEPHERSVSEIVKQLARRREQLWEDAKRIKKEMVAEVNKGRSPARTFAVGDSVMVDKHYLEKQPDAFKQRYHGPAEVLEKRKSSYRVRYDDTGQKNPIIRNTWFPVRI